MAALMQVALQVLLQLHVVVREVVEGLGHLVHLSEVNLARLALAEDSDELLVYKQVEWAPVADLLISGAIANNLFVKFEPLFWGFWHCLAALGMEVCRHLFLELSPEIGIPIEAVLAYQVEVLVK